MESITQVELNEIDRAADAADVVTLPARTARALIDTYQAATAAKIVIDEGRHGPRRNWRFRDIVRASKELLRKVA